MTMDGELREKVIKGMNACENEHECLLCPYDAEYTFSSDCMGALIKDAFALLKAQEPRVITLEEWDKWRHIPNGKRDPLYVQHSTGGWWILNYTNWMEIAFLTGEIRIWSSRPTDEQREAEPWVNT